MDSNNPSEAEVRNALSGTYFFKSNDVDDGASAVSEASKQSGMSRTSKASGVSKQLEGNGNKSSPTEQSNHENNEDENCLNQNNKQDEEQVSSSSSSNSGNAKKKRKNKGIFSRLFGSPKSQNHKDRKGNKTDISYTSGAGGEAVEITATSVTGASGQGPEIKNGGSGDNPLSATSTSSTEEGNNGGNKPFDESSNELKTHESESSNDASQSVNKQQDDPNYQPEGSSEFKDPLNTSQEFESRTIVGQSKQAEQHNSILESSTYSPDPKDDIFLPHGGSSSTCSDERRPLDSSVVQGILDSRIEEPSLMDYNYTPTKAMNSPGAAIPTPHWNKHGQDSNRALLFPHGSPDGDSIYYDMEEADERHFSPPAAFPKDSNSKAESFTWEQVQRYVHQTEERIREQLQEEHQQALSEFQKQAEQTLQEHGVQWKADAEAEYKKMDTLLKEEQYKTQQNEVTILHKTTNLENMKLQLDQVTRERRTYMSKVADLEAELQKTKGTASQSSGSQPASAEDHQDELRAMQAGKDAALQQVEALKEQVQLLMMKGKQTDQQEEVILLKAEKEMTERRVLELQEQIDAMIALRKAKELVMPDSGRESLPNDQQLVLAQAEIESLQRQLAGRDITTVEDLDRFKELLSKHQESQEEIVSLKQELKELSRLDDTSLIKSRDIEVELSIVKNDRDELMDKIDALQKCYNDDVKSAEHGSDSLIRTLQEELKSLRRLREADRLEQEQKFDQLRSSYDAKMEQLESAKQMSDTLLNSTTVSERDDLTAQLSAILGDDDIVEPDKQKNSEHERNQLIEDYESKLSTLQGDKDKMEQDHASELKAIKTKMNLDKKEYSAMQEKIQTMQKQLQSDTENARREALDLVEKETQLLQAQMKRERVRYEQEKIENDKECDMLCSKMEELRTYYKSEIEKTKHQTFEISQSEIAALQSQLEELRKEQQITSNKASNECEEREKQIRQLEGKHQEELEDLQRKSETEIFSLRRKLSEASTAFDSERKDLTGKLQDLEANNLVMEETHAVELEQAQADVREEMEAEFRKLQDEMEVLRSKADGSASDGKSDADRIRYEQQLQDLREEHGKEVEEMIAQLDLVEAEHNAKCVNQEKLIQEKEAVISALGSQLADAEKRLVDMDDKIDDLTLELDVVQEEAKRAKEELEQRAAELERLQLSHQKSMEAEVALREEACEAAREEMIERAEIQHQQANDVYKKLKHEYDSALDRISVLEKKIEKTTKELEEAKNARASREVDLADELAQVKACEYTALD